jgi:hydroxymethylpyrimidine kinase/phosphomethylpyrimidine kinase
MSSDKPNGKPICLAIGGLDPSGGAGLVADISALDASGVRAAAVITSVTFQNDQEVTGTEHMGAMTVERQIAAAVEGGDVRAVKTGMLPTREIVCTVAELVYMYGLRDLVIDPVFRATSGYQLVGDEAIRAMIGELMPLARLITPNVPEVEHITGISIEEEADVIGSAALLQEMGARAVLIKGGHLPEALLKAPGGGRQMQDYLFVDGEMTVLRSELADGANLRGTGCMLASAIAANLALGNDLIGSVESARMLVNNAIRSSSGN